LSLQKFLKSAIALDGITPETPNQGNRERKEADSRSLRLFAKPAWGRYRREAGVLDSAPHRSWHTGRGGGLAGDQDGTWPLGGSIPLRTA